MKFIASPHISTVTTDRSDTSLDTFQNIYIPNRIFCKVFPIL